MSVGSSGHSARPRHWRRVPFWSTFRRTKRIGYDSAELLSVYRDYGVIRKRDREDNFNVASEDLSSYQLVKPGDLVINKMKAWQGSLGVSRYTGIVSPAYFVYSQIGDGEQRFLNYLLRSSPYAGTFRALSKGIRPNQWDLDPDKLRTVALHLPPLDEQRRIADFLDAETAQIDALIAEQKHFIVLLRERRAAAIAEGLSELGGERTELRRVATVQTGVTLSGPGDPEAPEWPYLRVANVQVGYVDLSTVTTLRLALKDARTAVLRQGDVLMTEGGDIDKLGRGALWNAEIEPMLHQNHVFAVRPGPGLVPEFLVYWLDAPTARTHFYTTAKKTTNLASTNKTIVGRLPLVLPSVTDQRKFVDTVAASSGRIDAAIGEAEHNIALSKERRAALITAAVTGQIDVTTGRVA